MNIKNVDFGAMASRYKEELLGNVLPFWLEHSQDTKFGGYYTCLNRDGSVYDKDKFIWLQGREVWMFAMLYNKLAKNEEWLKCAEQGARFLMKYGHTPDYDFYFSLTREGKPVIQPYNIFSNTFALYGIRPVGRGDEAMRNMPVTPRRLSAGSWNAVPIQRESGRRLCREQGR